jgi:hypothetical protein
MAAAHRIDRLLVASVENGELCVRLIDAAQKRQVSEARAEPVGSDAASIAASAEALACGLIAAAGCTGEAAIDADSGVQVALDFQPFKGAQRVAAGVHLLTARAGDLFVERTLPVSREGAPRFAARVVRGQLLIAPPSELQLAAAEPPPVEPPAAAQSAAPIDAVSAVTIPAATSGKRWTHSAGIAAFAVGSVLGLTGVIAGIKSRSNIESAEAAYRQAGGAFRPADLDTLNSGNSLATGANVLFVASGALLVSGAILTWGF